MNDDFHRIRRLPPYVFAHIDPIKAKARANGVDVIDLGMGNPDMPTPAHIVEKLQETVKDPRTHRYSTSRGIPGLRRAQAGLLPAWVPGLLVGGAASIALDRLAGGAVGDALAVPWSVCTVADLAIVAGAAGWIATDRRRLRPGRCARRAVPASPTRWSAAASRAT